MLQTFDALAELVCHWAISHPAVRQIHAFGSRVKGTARSTSDLDLAIHADQNPTDTGATTVHFEMEAWQAELTSILGLPVDVEELTDEHVRRFVREASVLIYHRPNTPLIEP